MLLAKWSMSSVSIASCNVGDFSVTTLHSDIVLKMLEARVGGKVIARMTAST